MSGFNWDKLRKENNKKMRKMDWYRINQAKKKMFNTEKMQSALEQYGWQKCPRCGGGRHPSFTLCKKCRTNP